MSSKASVASGLEFRLATEADAPFLTDLRNRLAKHFLSSAPATLLKTLWMIGPRSLTYILEVGGRRAGAFSLYEWDEESASVEFGRFMLEPWAQGNGYGSVMLEYAITRARELGARKLRLVTKPQNAAACELYTDLGFEVTQLRMELRLD